MVQQSDAAAADYVRFFGSGEARGEQSFLTQGLTPLIGSGATNYLTAGIDFVGGTALMGSLMRSAWTVTALDRQAALATDLRGLIASIDATAETSSTIAARIGESSVARIADLDVAGIRAQRILLGDSDKVAVIGRNMGDFPKRGEYGVVDFARVLRNDNGFDTELFAGPRIKQAWFDEIDELKLFHGVEFLPDEIVRTTEIFRQNVLWARKVVDEGYTVVDIGNPGFKSPSVFYGGETAAIFNSKIAGRVLDFSSANLYKQIGAGANNTIGNASSSMATNAKGFIGTVDESFVNLSHAEKTQVAFGRIAE